MYRKNQVLGRFCPAQHPDSRFILFCNCLIFSIMQSENSLKLCSPFWNTWFCCHVFSIKSHFNAQSYGKLSNMPKLSLTYFSVSSSHKN